MIEGDIFDQLGNDPDFLKRLSAGNFPFEFNEGVFKIEMRRYLSERGLYPFNLYNGKEIEKISDLIPPEIKRLLGRKLNLPFKDLIKRPDMFLVLSVDPRTSLFKRFQVSRLIKRDDPIVDPINVELILNRITSSFSLIVSLTERRQIDYSPNPVYLSLDFYLEMGSNLPRGNGLRVGIYPFDHLYAGAELTYSPNGILMNGSATLEADIWNFAPTEEEEIKFRNLPASYEEFQYWAQRTAIDYQAALQNQSFGLIGFSRNPMTGAYSIEAPDNLIGVIPFAISLKENNGLMLLAIREVNNEIIYQFPVRTSPRDIFFKSVCNTITSGRLADFDLKSFQLFHS